MSASPGSGKVSPLCLVCTRLHRGEGSPACDAFPEGIPDDILEGEPHVGPHQGDSGLAFRKSSMEPSFFLAGADPGTLFRVTCAGSFERYVPILDLWELDNSFIRYVLSIHLPVRALTTNDAEAFVEAARECLESMNPCMREIRRMMYLCSHQEKTFQG